MAIGQIIKALGESHTGKLLSVDYSHHEIHSGSAYIVSQISAADALDTASPMTFRIVTPTGDKQLHLVSEAVAAAAGFFEVFEDNGNDTFYNVSGGDSVTPINRNRNSSNTSIATVTSGVTVTRANSTVRIYAQRLGGFRQAGGASLRAEFVLKSNCDYLFRLSTDADNNEGSIVLDWYEHTDRG